MSPRQEGFQVLEGSTIPIQVDVFDDVQVRNVELLANGEVVSNDVSFPFELQAIALNATSENTTLDIQARATDTGGNIALSNTLTFDLIDDNISPILEAVSPTEGDTIVDQRRITLSFSEPLDPTTVTAENFQLVTANNTVIPLENIQLREDNSLIQLTYDQLLRGELSLNINSSEITDRAGNALGIENITSSFTAKASLVLGDEPDIVFVIDKSGSTSSIFAGTSVGDQNNDGRANTILDAEIAGVAALNQRLIDIGLGDTADIAVVAFDTLGVQAGPSVNPNTDINSNGTPDLIDSLQSVRASGGTQFEAALRQAENIFSAFGSSPGEGNLIFLSDGFSNEANFNDEVRRLENRGINIRAFGVGESSSLNQLQEIESLAEIFTNTDQLLTVFGEGV